MAAARLCALAATLSFASSVLADTIGVLPVAPPPGPSPELVARTAELGRLVAARAPGVVDAGALRDRMAAATEAAAPAKSLAELDRGYEAARAAALADDFEGAVRRLRAVIDDLEKLPESDEDYRQWTRAMLRLAKTDLDYGRTEDAHQVLLRLVRVTPDVEVDPRLYPPRFSRMVEDAKREVKTMPGGRLSVSSPQAGAHVWIDGRDVGAAPVTLALPRGRHRVSVVQGGRRAGPLQVEVGDGDRAVSLDVAAPEAFRPHLPGLAVPDDERVRRLPSAGALLGLDTLVATSFALQGNAWYLAATVWDVHRATPIREGRVKLAENAFPPGAAAALAEYVTTGQTASPLVELPGRAPDLRVAEPAKPAVDLKTPPPQREEKSKALGWTAFATGVATVGLTGFSVWQGLKAKSAYDDANAVRDVDPAKYNAKLEEGDSAKKNATIGGIAAGACGVATIVLGWIAIKETGEVGPFRF